MILFCATEAGGARELIPVVKEALRKGESCRVLVSAVTATLFTGAGIETEDCAVTDHVSAMTLLKEAKADAIVLGTTGIIKAERYLTAAARERGIRSIAVLDEWYNYALRFQDENGTIGAYLPDVICAQDEQSKELAIKEGIPASVIRITGSPALAELTIKARDLMQHPPEVPDLLKKNPGVRSMLFLSEPLKAAYGDRGGKGTHGSFLGFHEEIVREDLADALRDAGERMIVLEKLHPSEKEKPAPETPDNVEWHVLAGRSELLPLLWHCDGIVGMCSKTLLESAILGRNPVSYQPDANDPEKCTAVRLGAVTLCSEKDRLLACILESMKRAHEGSGSGKTFAFADPAAAANILAIATNGK